MAEEYKLFPVYKEEFHHVFTEHRDDPEFGTLMIRMKVVNANGESAMDVDQWDAASTFPSSTSFHRLTMIAQMYTSHLHLKSVDEQAIHSQLRGCPLVSDIPKIAGTFLIRIFVVDILRCVGI